MLRRKTPSFDVHFVAPISNPLLTTRLSSVLCYMFWFHSMTSISVLRLGTADPHSVITCKVTRLSTPNFLDRISVNTKLMVCLFTVQVHQSQANHLDVRKACIQYMREHKDMFEQVTSHSPLSFPWFLHFCALWSNPNGPTISVPSIHSFVHSFIEF